jgi:eukaryotic-like serine/threonine-protein kinase
MPRRIELDVGGLVADRFRLVRKLGTGGSGVVWEARDETRGGRQVALKLLQATDAGAVDSHRFVREARALSRFSHPNVRRIHEALELEDFGPILVLEYLEGESFANFLGERKSGVEALLGLLVPVVSAIGAAHAAGIVHRDLKPQNLFVCADGRPMVLDFGVAKLQRLEGVSTEGTAAGALVGTPWYMAPEQVFGERDVDHRADVWALGIILYQGLTGVLPTMADNVGQVFKAIVNESLRPIHELEPDLPFDLAELLTGMLRRDRRERLQDLREVQTVLLRHAGGISAPELRAPLAQPRDAAGSEAVTPELRTLDTLDTAASVDAGSRTRAALLEGGEERHPTAAASIAPAMAPRRTVIAIGASTLCLVGAGLLLAMARPGELAQQAPTPPSRPLLTASSEPRASSPPPSPDTAAVDVERPRVAPRPPPRPIPSASTDPLGDRY